LSRRTGDVAGAGGEVERESALLPGHARGHARFPETVREHAEHVAEPIVAAGDAREDVVGDGIKGGGVGAAGGRFHAWCLAERWAPV
jgi:hypothetical protein